jgi:acyl-homoserine lactone acylase PvdQ
VQELFLTHAQPTELQQAMLSNPVPVNGVQVPYMLCADSAYGAHRFVLPAFKDAFTANRADRRWFNRVHAKTRNPIECAYGRLKQRWRVLLKPQMLKLKNVVKVVTACCILHNICEERRCWVDDSDAAFQAALQRYNARYGAAAAAPAAAASTTGAAIREAMVQHLSS